MSTSATVAALEAELDAMDRRNSELESALTVVTHERDNLRDQLILARGERDEYMVAASQMRSIMEATSSGLVQGLRRMADADQRRKDLKRGRQEADLGINSTPAPLFISSHRRRNRIDNEFQEQEQEKPEQPAPAPVRETAQVRAPASPPVVRAPVPSAPVPSLNHAGPYHNDPRLPPVTPVTESDFREIEAETDRISRENDRNFMVQHRPTYTPEPTQTREDADRASLAQLADQIGGIRPTLNDPQERPYIRERRRNDNGS